MLEMKRLPLLLFLTQLFLHRVATSCYPCIHDIHCVHFRVGSVCDANRCCCDPSFDSSCSSSPSPPKKKITTTTTATPSSTISTTSSTTTTTSPPSPSLEDCGKPFPNCEDDRNANCDLYKSNGACGFAFLGGSHQKTCQRTCGFCTTKRCFTMPSTTCIDDDSTWCPSNVCSSRPTLYLVAHCPRKCGLCHKIYEHERAATINITSLSATSTTSSKNTSTSPPSPSLEDCGMPFPNCEDASVSKCEIFNSNGVCGFAFLGDDSQKYCQRTCGFCTTKRCFTMPSTTCIDEDSKWCSTGNVCKEQPSLVMLRCPRTCGVCHKIYEHERAG